ncbi:MAG: ACT domain-containing protein [Clostridia bacterium]|nr:ACT domain-containing protein [Clostridia bacterium]
MSIKQISVFLENKPGTLNRMTKVLADAGIDIRALSLAETKDFGIARMIVDDIITAAQALKEADFVANMNSVLAYAIPDEPGGLNKLLEKFSEAEVNIEYMYSCIMDMDASHAYMIFRVTDTKTAEAKLAGKGLVAVRQEQLI